MSTNTSVAGFAIRRNGSCIASLSETDCGGTVDEFRACCPHPAFCPSSRSPSRYSVYCCDQAVNCTVAIIQEGPFCANESWTLFNNNGYFCCDAGRPGYKNTKKNSYGCANPGYQTETWETWLTPIGQKAKRENDLSLSYLALANECLIKPLLHLPAPHLLRLQPALPIHRMWVPSLAASWEDSQSWLSYSSRSGSLFFVS
jgi:hypothetical protein